MLISSCSSSLAGASRLSSPGAGSARPVKVSISLASVQAVRVGSSNVVAVKVEAMHPDSWWYDGGGLYRPVRLRSAEQLRIAQWGVYLPTWLTSPPLDGRADAQVMASVEVLNEGGAAGQARVNGERLTPKCWSQWSTEADGMGEEQLGKWFLPLFAGEC